MRQSWLARGCGALGAVVLLAVAVSAPADKVFIDLNAPSVRRLPLAVPVLKQGTTDAATASVVLAETLRADFGASSLFEVLDPKGYLEDPQRAPLQPEASSFETWKTVGAEALVKGRVDRDRDSLVVELRAYDVFRRSQLLGKRYTAAASESRTVAHMFANAVLEELTGTPGPFGTRIAYVVQQGKSKELALVEMDGSNAKRLTKAGSLSINPSWSRDGKYLYYTSYMMGGADLFLLDLASWKTWVVSRTPGINMSGRDSPDGKELLLTLSKDGNPEIYRMDKATRGFTRLTQNRSIDVAPTWSPDGKRIAFVSDRNGSPHVFVMGRDGDRVKRLTFSGSHNGDPEWSPKADLIAYTGKDDKGVFQVFLVDPEGRETRQVTFGPKDTMDPTWSPDGRFLAVSSLRDGKSAIYVVRLGAQEFRRISPGGEEASQPTWCPRVFPS